MGTKKKEKKWLSITKKQDFFLLKKQGKKLSKAGFFLVYRENRLFYCRFALCFSKYTGSAVLRNRFKRWARSFLKKQKWEGKWDILLGFEKKEKDFYQGLKYTDFCCGFKVLCQNIEKSK